VAEGGGLLNFPWSCRFNLPNNLHAGASPLNWGNSASLRVYLLPILLPRFSASGLILVLSLPQPAASTANHNHRQ
jgi:hypothetical protein